MRLSEIEKSIGEVVVLDLVNGAQVTTAIKGVTDDGYVVVGKLLIFQVTMEPRNPMAQPHPEENPMEHRVRNAPYGYPLYETKDGTEIEAAHVVMTHPVAHDQAKVYHHVVSGIQLATAGDLSALNAANSQK